MSDDNSFDLRLGSYTGVSAGVRVDDHCTVLGDYDYDILPGYESRRISHESDCVNDTERLRQELLLGLEMSDFFVTSYTYLNLNSQNLGGRKVSGETNIWMGHPLFPIEFAFQAEFFDYKADLTRLGIRWRITDTPYFDDVFGSIGLTATAQIFPLEVCLRKGYLEQMSWEFSYVLDPFRDVIPDAYPRLLGVLDQEFLGYDDATYMLRSENRLEVMIPIKDYLTIAPFAEYRAYYSSLGARDMSNSAAIGVGFYLNFNGN